MTLATVSRYAPDRVQSIGNRAVVIGGSMAGLLTARILADGFEQVTVIERDPIPDGVENRRGVPQGRHVHVLEEAGRATFEDLFPGFGEELLSHGGVIVDIMSDFIHYEKGDYLADGEIRFDTYFASRPLFETVIRERVRSYEGVRLRFDSQFLEYVVDGDNSGISGVTIRTGEGTEEDLDADLVVDATGRTSRTPRWLERNGYSAPPVDEVTVDLAYSTTVIERPPDDRRTFFVAPNPPETRGLGMFPVEHDRWLTTLVGYHGDHPPTDSDEFLDYAQSLPIDEPSRLLSEQPWLSDEVAHYPFPSNLRRRFEDLDEFPDNLVVIGDAVASFNPIYGQGMSVAALEALQLHHELAQGGITDLPMRFFDQIEDIVDIPWSITVGGDFEFSQTDGPKPRGTDLINRYLARLVRTAHSDGRMREPLVRVFFLEQPPTRLFRPGVLWRAITPF